MTARQNIAATIGELILQNTEMQAKLQELESAVPTIYGLLLECYRSGQIDETQWQQHLRDEPFARWVSRLQPKS